MTGTAAALPKYQFYDAVGAPLANGTITTYLVGTTTLSSTWQDSDLTTLNTNPVVLDSHGECMIWLDSTKVYKVVLKNSAGVTQWSQDNIVGSAENPSITLTTAVLATYQGAASSNPATRTGGTALQNGDLYFNTSTNRMMAFANGVWYATETAGATDADLVAYTPAGTGAVASTVQTKLRESYDAINDFGCDNTGATNTTTKLLAFYNACIATGAKGVIRAGTYKVTTGVLVFDNGFTDKSWPHIETDGHQSTYFQIDSATETNAAVLTWSNGTASSGVGKYWRGGSHGSLTIIGSGTGAAYTSQHHYSLTGTWGIQFGWMASTSCKGTSFYCPVNLYGGTNPDPYANSFLHFEGIESNYSAGYGFYNANYVGMDSWHVENVRIIQPSLGGWFGLGSGNIINNLSMGNVTGRAFDDGTYVAATGGAPQRNYITVAEFDNCQYGIRLNRSSRTKFIGVRFIHRYLTTPNASALYWPLSAVDIAGGTSPSVSTIELDIQHRIESGGVVGNLGIFTNANSSGNIHGADINFDYVDNAGFGLVDSQVMGIGYSTNQTILVSRKTRSLFDSRDKAYSFGRGSAAATLVPNAGFGTVSSRISFPSQRAGYYSTSSIYSTVNSVFTAPRAGWYRVEVAIPLVMAIGTRVRMALFDGATTLMQIYAYQVNAGNQTYVLNASVILTQGQSLYVMADQNTASATVAANIISDNQEARFVVQEI